MTALLVIAGAMIGAPIRYVADRYVQSKHESTFPWGTFAVNVAGSALLGFLAQAALGHHAFAFLGTGLCGALTTYSTFGYETVRLIETRARFYAIVNVAASVVAGLGAAMCGAAVANAFWM